MDSLSQMQGFLLGSGSGWYALGSVFFLLCLGFWGAPLIAWTLVLGALMMGFAAPLWAMAAFLVIAAVFNIKPVRQMLVSSSVLKLMKALNIIPTISETERTAINAGVVWAEGELFSGKPNFEKLMNEPYPNLTAEENSFIHGAEGPVERFCTAVDDWKYWKTRQMDPAAFDIIKKEKFFGMIIPKEYGGLGFSAMAHSEVIMKIASRSCPAAVTVMVPNSLGPAELLIHYGTEAQKKYYLPRLASGEEIPCFALTEPLAGSDAGAISASGVLFKGPDGKLYLKLNWNKRYITLAAISTLLGLAFKMKDPDNILGRGTDLGITCALIPTTTAGVVIGRRHDPLGVPFYNCPTQGHDVVVSVDQIVGGIEGAGHGWKMLMECLAAGRGISLPAQSAGGLKLGTRLASAHASIRRQFGTSIAKFEGIEEPLSRIAGFTYMCEALRRYTLGAIDKGLKPSVITAMTKYNSTELGRKVVNDVMDIMAGNAISKGPRNTVAHMYIASPIGLTVEGANILTRTLIIFGQGALRAHPFAYKEVLALEKGDLSAFDSAFWGHIGHIVRNGCRSILLSVSRANLTSSPKGGPTARYFKKLSWVSASFAIMADLAMGTLGGKLKSKEKLTGRFADILSWMYIGTAILRRYHAEGERKEDLPFVHFTMNHVFVQIQSSFDGIFANFEVPGMTWFFKGPLRWWSGLNSIAVADSDAHTHKIASLITQDSEQRERITHGIYISKDPQDAVTRLDRAFKAVKAAELIEAKMRAAIREGKLKKAKGPALAESALQAGVITSEEHKALGLADALRVDAVQVDDFSEEEYVSYGHSVPPPRSNTQLRANA